MNNQIKIPFLILVLVQGLHSVEEYFRQTLGRISTGKIPNRTRF